MIISSWGGGRTRPAEHEWVDSIHPNSQMRERHIGRGGGRRRHVERAVHGAPSWRKAQNVNVCSCCYSGFGSHFSLQECNKQRRTPMGEHDWLHRITPRGGHGLVHSVLLRGTQASPVFRFPTRCQLLQPVLQLLATTNDLQRADRSQGSQAGRDLSHPTLPQMCPLEVGSCS